MLVDITSLTPLPCNDLCWASFIELATVEAAQLRALYQLELGYTYNND